MQWMNEWKLARKHSDSKLLLGLEITWVCSEWIAFVAKKSDSKLLFGLEITGVCTEWMTFATIIQFTQRKSRNAIRLSG
jgi:hypothetical protein